jgi:hypothetical protein
MRKSEENRVKGRRGRRNSSGRTQNRRKKLEDWRRKREGSGAGLRLCAEEQAHGCRERGEGAGEGSRRGTGGRGRWSGRGV